MGGAAMEAAEVRACEINAYKRKQRKGRFYTCMICEGQYKHRKMAKTWDDLIVSICLKCLEDKKEDVIYKFKRLESKEDYDEWYRNTR